MLFVLFLFFSVVFFCVRIDFSSLLATNSYFLSNLYFFLFMLWGLLFDSLVCYSGLNLLSYADFLSPCVWIYCSLRKNRFMGIFEVV
jgi:hypothetical protein